MALQQVNQYQPTQEKEESPWDKIAKGLQIAEGVFKIPVAWEQFKTLQKQGDAATQEARIKGIEADTKQRQAGGVYTEAELQEKKRVELQPPVEENGTYLNPPTPEHAGPALVPPRFPGLKGAPVQILKPDGSKAQAMVYDKEEEQKLIGQEEGMQKQVENNDRIKIAQQAELNFMNADRGFEAGSKEGDLLALSNLQKLYMPGVAKMADGTSIANADGIFEELNKKIMELKTGDKQILLPGERAAFRKFGQEAMSSYQKLAEEEYGRYAELARGSGLRPDRVGVRFKGPEQYQDSPKKSSGNAPAKLAKPKFVDEKDWNDASPALKQQLMNMKR